MQFLFCARVLFGCFLTRFLAALTFLSVVNTYSMIFSGQKDHEHELNTIIYALILPPNLLLLIYFFFIKAVY